MTLPERIFNKVDKAAMEAADTVQVAVHFVDERSSDIPGAYEIVRKIEDVDRAIGKMTSVAYDELFDTDIYAVDDRLCKSVDDFAFDFDRAMDATENPYVKRAFAALRGYIETIACAYECGCDDSDLDDLWRYQCDFSSAVNEIADWDRLAYEYN